MHISHHELSSRASHWDPASFPERPLKWPLRPDYWLIFVLWRIYHLRIQLYELFWLFRDQNMLLLCGVVTISSSSFTLTEIAKKCSLFGSLRVIEYSHSSLPGCENNLIYLWMPFCANHWMCWNTNILNFFIIPEAEYFQLCNPSARPDRSACQDQFLIWR